MKEFSNILLVDRLTRWIFLDIPSLAQGCQVEVTDVPKANGNLETVHCLPLKQCKERRNK
jgi:hypothetical protein